MQIAGLVSTPEVYKAVKEAISQYKEALRPHVRGSVYLNFMKGKEATERAKDGYLPESYARLVALKAKYDPENMFRFSYQLVPQDETES